MRAVSVLAPGMPARRICQHIVVGQARPRSVEEDCSAVTRLMENTSCHHTMSRIRQVHEKIR
jgi:hypothetical protein